MFGKIKLWIFGPFVLILLYNKLFEAITGNDLFAHVDELFVALFLMIVGYDFITKFRVNKIGARPLFVIFVFVIVTLFSKYYSNFVNVALCAFIHVKWFLIFYAVYEIFKDDYIFLKRLFIFSICASTFGVIVNFVMQEQFNIMFNQDIMIRDNKLRMMGLEMHPNNLGILLSLVFLYYNFFNGLPSYTKILISTIVFAFLCIFLLGSRTPLIVVPLSYGYLLLGKKNKFFSFVVIIVLSVFSTVALVLWGQSIIERTKKNVSAITTSPDQTEYLRGIMIYNGLKLSYMYFPIGTGMATFGTSLSQGSKVYDDIKINGKGTFEKMEGGLYDSNIASILGEMGFLGISLILFLLYSNYSFCKNILTSSKEKMHYIKLIFMTVLIFFLLAPILINGYPCMIYAVFITMQLSKERYYKTQRTLSRITPHIAMQLSSPQPIIAN